MPVAGDHFEIDRLPERCEAVPGLFHPFLPIAIAVADEHRDLDVSQSIQAVEVRLLDGKAGERRQRMKPLRMANGDDERAHGPVAEAGNINARQA